MVGFLITGVITELLSLDGNEPVASD